MTTPLVFKAFNVIEKLNSYSYPYIISWNENLRELTLQGKTIKLLPWHVANIGVVFFLHFCIPIFLLIERATSGEKIRSNKDFFQIGALFMMSCHSTASYGINFLVYRHAEGFVSFFNALLKFEARVRGRFITSKEIKRASMKKELNLEKLANRDADLGLVILAIVYIVTGVPAITPVPLVLEDVDPFGIFLKRVLIPDYDSLPWHFKVALVTARIGILTVAMLEISQTFRIIFNFGLSIFHIYIKCLAEPQFQNWDGWRTVKVYNEFRVIHSSILPFMTPLAAFFLGLNFLILTVSTVLCLVSHKILPFHIYVGIPLATAMAFSLLFTTLPFAIKSFEMTSYLLRNWQRGVIINSTRLRYWKKVLKTLRPVAFYCGGIGILTQDTKRVYIASVIDGTTNVLLWKDSIK